MNKQSISLGGIIGKIRFGGALFAGLAIWVTAGEAGAIVGPIHLFGGIAAMSLIGWIVTLPIMRKQHRVPWVLSILVLFGTIISIALLLVPSVTEMTWLFWLYIPTIYLTIGPGFGILNNLAGPRMRAMFCAVVLFTSNIANLIIAPQLIGFLSDAFAQPHPADANSLQLALLCLTPVGLWSAFHFAKCSRAMRKPVAQGIALNSAVEHDVEQA